MNDRSRHFLIRPSEVDGICAALRRIASGPLVVSTIDVLRAAQRQAEAAGDERIFRFKPPEGAECLMTLAAIRARGDEGHPLDFRPLIQRGWRNRKG